MSPDPALTPELIQARAFTAGFRGYDQTEVRDFLTRISAEVRALRERAEHLESAWRSAEERAARPPVLDEETLMAAVGEETAAILRAARSAAGDLRTRAAEQNEATLAAANAEAAAIRAEAEKVLGYETDRARHAAEGILESARTEAAEMVSRARSEAEEIRSKAEQERTLTIEGANATRERILEDLSRRVATVQIEQLRAGRERLLESYAVVRRTLEEAQEELTRADAEARAAADDVGRRLQQEQKAADAAEAEHEAHEAHEAHDAGGARDAGAEAGTLPDAARGGEHRAAGGQAAAAVALKDAGEAAPAANTEAESGSTGGEKALDSGPGPHLRVVPDPEAAGGGGPEATAEGQVPGSAVDQLFARIRSGKPDGAKRKGRSAHPTEDNKPKEEKAPSPAATDAEATPAEARAAEAPVAESPVVEAAEAGEAGEAVSDGAAVPGDEVWLQKRESSIHDLEVNLTRKLKRALQDEQNDLLDRLRGVRGELTSAALLPEPDAHRARYVEAALPLVEQAAAGGVAFAGDTLEGGTTQPSPQVADLAEEAAEAIVGALRRRLEQVVDSSSGEDQSVVVESLGSAYREWKSQRIERVAGDALSAAFSRGTWEAVPDGTLLRWIAEDVDGPCPDCDDDALAGGLPKGEPFPTGQPYPPAHTGCRCLLVPVTA